MKTLKEVLDIFKRHTTVNLDVGPQVKALFDAAIESKKVYSYDAESGNCDKQDTHIKLFRFGQWEQNRLYLKVINSKNNTEFYGFIDSCVAWPCMKDRFFGIDIMDQQNLSELYDIMTLIYKDELESTWEYKPA